MDERRAGGTAVAVALMILAWLIVGCGSSSPAARSATHPSSAPSRTGAVYADCASATFLAVDFLAKAVHGVSPADINNVIRQGERQAAGALEQGVTRIDALPASERRTSEGAHLEQELDKTRSLLEDLALHVSRRTTPLASTEIRDLGVVMRRAGAICPRSA